MSNLSPAVATNENNFAALFEESLTRQEMRAGEVITAEVVRVDMNFVVVNAGLKSESFIPVEEFRNDAGEVEAKAGDFVSVAIEALEDGFGETRLSREKAKRLAAWMRPGKGAGNGELVSGVISGKVKGGLTVMANGIRAFLPGSLVDIRPVKDTTPFEGKTMEFKVIKLDRKRNNVVVSRRAVLEASQGEERAEAAARRCRKARSSRASSRTSPTTARSSTWAASTACCTSPISPGAASSIRPKCSTVGDEVTAKILKFDQEKNRVSLGMKQLGEDPWVGLSRRYPTGTRLFGKVTNLTDYGAFVEVEQGIEGLVHVSEMDWTNKNVHPSKVVQLGDEVEVMILEIDEERRRISLGMKQCLPNPWDEFAINFKKGDASRGRSSRSPISACSSDCRAASTAWCTCRTCPGARPAKRPCATTRRATRSRRWCWRSTSSASAFRWASSRWTATRSPITSPPTRRTASCRARSRSVDAKGAVIALDGDVEGYLRVSEVSRERIEDLTHHLKEGDAVTAMIINIDRKNRSINLSVKAKDMAEEQGAMQKLQSESAASSGSTSLGALLKAKLDNKNSQQ